MVSSVQSLSHVWLFVTPWIAAHQASLSITNTRSSLRLASIESVMTSSHLILCRPLLLLPPIPPSIKVFSNESTLHMRWPSTGVSAWASFLPKKSQGWSPSEWTGWILAVQRTLKSLLQHQSSKVSILWCSTFFIVQLSIDSFSVVLRGNRFVQESRDQLSGCWKDPFRDINEIRKGLDVSGWRNILEEWTDKSKARR